MFLVAGIVAAAVAQADEVSLYDSAGDAVAYIDTDSDLTIYTWNGKPTAYLNEEHVYGFNGKHLGWFEQGILWDNNGRGVGFVKGAVNMVTNLQPLKGLKELRPLKSLKELPPLKPMKSRTWSPVPLSLYLMTGAD